MSSCLIFHTTQKLPVTLIFLFNPNMPSTSFRDRALLDFLSTYRVATRLSDADNLHHLIDGDFHKLDSNNETFLLAACVHQQFRCRQQSRYTQPQRCRRQPLNVFLEGLSTNQDCNYWLSNDEFLCKYRVSRESLHEITQEIKDDLIFARAQRGRRQMPVKHQLMIWLHFIGHEGNTCPNQGKVFKS
jgi:hypothetical protein